MSEIYAIAPTLSSSEEDSSKESDSKENLPPKNYEVSNDKKAPSSEVENFFAGNIDPEEYKLVDISTQYVFTYRDKKTGKKTSLVKQNYINMETLDFKFHQMVYGTKQFYMRVRTGNFKNSMTDLTKYYDTNMNVDAQLAYESNVFVYIIGAVIFSILLMVFSGIMRKINNILFGHYFTVKTKILKLLDADYTNYRSDWNLHDMSIKKEFKGDLSEDIMKMRGEFLETQPLLINPSLNEFSEV